MVGTPIEAAAAATGGLYQSTIWQTTIEMAINQIVGQLNTQYTVSYRRARSDAPDCHRIKVEIVSQRGW